MAEIYIVKSGKASALVLLAQLFWLLSCLTMVVGADTIELDDPRVSYKNASQSPYAWEYNSAGVRFTSGLECAG
jgi:hypothetical protein